MVDVRTLESWAPRVLSILRIVAALIFMLHGTQKLLGFPVSPNTPEVLSLPWIAGAFELVGGGAAADRTLHVTDCIHPVRRDGVRLLDRACAAEIRFRR